MTRWDSHTLRKEYSYEKDLMTEVSIPSSKNDISVLAAIKLTRLSHNSSSAQPRLDSSPGPESRYAVGRRDKVQGTETKCKNDTKKLPVA